MATLVITGVTRARTYISDPNLPDTVRVDSVRALRGSHVAIPIRIVTDQPLSGIEITLKLQSPSLSLDSFSFTGSIVNYLQLKGAVTYDSVITTYAFPYSDFFIYPGRGLFGTMYVTMADTATTGLIRIDSTTLLVDVVEHSTWFSDFELQTFVPQFEAGYVDLQDSCCVGGRGNVDGSPDDGIDISDLTVMIGFLFLNFDLRLRCPEESDVSPAVGDGVIDISDLTAMVQFLFVGGIDSLPSCL